jgi:hypothetical protein
LTIAVRNQRRAIFWPAELFGQKSPFFVTFFGEAKKVKTTRANTLHGKEEATGIASNFLASGLNKIANVLLQILSSISLGNILEQSLARTLLGHVSWSHSNILEQYLARTLLGHVSWSHS